MHVWEPIGSFVVDPGSLKIGLAARFLHFICERCSDFVTFVECRAFDDREVVAFDLQIERPQYPVYDIYPVEGVSICFFPENRFPPAVFATRPTFPDTPHQNLAPVGFPAQICIDDRPWQEISSGFDAPELMARIVSWFTKACQGELHDLNQPLDPVFINDLAYEIIVTADTIQAIENGNEKLVATIADAAGKYLIIFPLSKVKNADVRPNIVVGHCAVDPAHMTRMKRSPQTLAELNAFFAERNVSLLDNIKSIIDTWFADTNGRPEPGTSMFVLLVRMPIIHPLTKEVSGNNTVAFVVEMSLGEMGERLGFLLKNDTSEQQQVTYTKHLTRTASMDQASEIPIRMALVHRDFDIDLATALSGRKTADTRCVALIGAGSLGSQLAESLTREGFFKWTVIDDDVLLPHNLSRHTLTHAFMCQSKADGLSKRLRHIREDSDAVALNVNVLSADVDVELTGLLKKAALIIDASASVAVARNISDRPVEARRVSAFFTPTGMSSVLMIEDTARATSLRDLESCYLREVLSNPKLESHIGNVDDMPYTGACRAITNRISSTSVHLLTGLIAHEIAKQADKNTTILKIWSLEPDGSVSCISVPAAARRYTAEDWSIHIPETLLDFLFSERRDKLPNETGGVLLGMIDLNIRRIDIVHGLLQPEDSISSPTGFTRGKRRLRKAVEKAIKRSGNQVRYIGEWHSHPVGCSTAPSRTDVEQIGELTFILDEDGLPAISLIVGSDNINVIVGEKVG